MKAFHYILGIAAALALMVTLLITSVEAVVYWNPGYFEKEYTKYQVLDDLPAMTMDDLLEVTHEMMDYLRGDREDLHVYTTLDGQEREFFNEREIAHMEDVRNLFVGAIQLRVLCLWLIALCLVLLAVVKAPLKRVIPRSICAGAGLFLAVLAILAGIIASDFSRYFVVFHHIFFDNDLWILDPRTDLLINIVPEGFFMDTAARIGGLFALLTGLFLLASILVIRRQAKGK